MGQIETSGFDAHSPRAITQVSCWGANGGSSGGSIEFIVEAPASHDHEEIVDGSSS